MSDDNLEQLFQDRYEIVVQKLAHFLHEQINLYFLSVNEEFELAQKQNDDKALKEILANAHKMLDDAYAYKVKEII